MSSVQEANKSVVDIETVRRFIGQNEELISKKDKNILSLILKKIEIQKAEVTEADKEESEKLKFKGNDLFKEGKLEESLEMYNKALEKNPKNHFLYSNRSLVFQKLGIDEKAIEDCLIGIEIDPSFIKFYIRLGTLLEDEGERMKYIEEGLKHDPDNKMLLEMKEHVPDTETTESPFDPSTFDSLLKNKGLQDMVSNFVKDKSPEELNRMMNDVLGKFGGKK